MQPTQEIQTDELVEPGSRELALREALQWIWAMAEVYSRNHSFQSSWVFREIELKARAALQGKLWT